MNIEYKYRSVNEVLEILGDIGILDIVLLFAFMAIVGFMILNIGPKLKIFLAGIEQKSQAKNRKRALKQIKIGQEIEQEIEQELEQGSNITKNTPKIEDGQELDIIDDDIVDSEITIGGELVGEETNEELSPGDKQTPSIVDTNEEEGLIVNNYKDDNDDDELFVSNYKDDGLDLIVNNDEQKDDDINDIFGKNNNKDNSSSGIEGFPGS